MKPSFVLLLLLPCLVAADWPHWRGAERNGVTPETSGFVDGDWRIQPAWKASVDEGSSSPIVADGRIYTIGHKEGNEVVRCLDLSDGKELWSQSYRAREFGRASKGDKGMYRGPSATPEYDAASGLLFTLGVDGDLNAWNTNAGGKRVWGFNLYERYRAPQRPNVGKRNSQRDYGYTTAPLAIGNQLLVEVGAKTGNLISFQIKSGKENWRSENRDEAGHTGGPALIEVDGQPCAAVLTLRNLVVTAIDGDNAGKTVGLYKWTTDYGNNIASPAVSGNSLVVTSAYNHFAMCKLTVTKQGLQKDWEIEGQASGVCTPVIHDEHIYWAWRGVHCADLATGKQIWVGGAIGDPGSCLVTGDDRLIVWGNRGELSLVETAKRSPTKFQQLATEKVLSRTDAWPHVVLAAGRLLCKDRAGQLRCFTIAR